MHASVTRPESTRARADARLRSRPKSPPQNRLNLRTSWIVLLAAAVLMPAVLESVLAQDVMIILKTRKRSIVADRGEADGIVVDAVYSIKKPEALGGKIIGKARVRLLRPDRSGLLVIELEPGAKVAVGDFLVPELEATPEDLLFQEMERLDGSGDRYIDGLADAQQDGAVDRPADNFDAPRDVNDAPLDAYDMPSDRYDERPLRLRSTNRESWYTLWALGGGVARYPAATQAGLNALKSTPGVSHITVVLDAFGFYWHVHDQVILGGIINAAGDRYSFAGNWAQVNHFLIGGSSIWYPLGVFGTGLFLRGDAGVAVLSIDSSAGSANSEAGVGGLAGGGWSFDLGGTRLLLGANWSYRHVEGDGASVFGVSVGGLF